MYIKQKKKKKGNSINSRCVWFARKSLFISHIKFNNASKIKKKKAFLLYAQTDEDLYKLLFEVLKVIFGKYIKIYVRIVLNLKTFYNY